MKSNIKFISVNPAGTLLFVIDDLGRAILASLLSHATISFLKFSEPVTAPPKFSADGLVVAVAVGRMLEVWRVPNFAADDRQFAPWHLIKRILQHQGAIVSIEWSNDDISVGSVKRGHIGRWITTASEDMTCRVFKMEYRKKALIRQVFVKTVEGKTEEDSGEAEMVNVEEDSDEEEEEEECSEHVTQTRQVKNTQIPRRTQKSIHRPLVISVHRHQPILSTFHVTHDSEDQPQVFLLTLSREGSLFVWDFNQENGRLTAERGQKFRIAVSKEEDDEEEENNNKKQHNSVTNISATARPERWARLRSVSFRAGRLLVGFTDGIFGLFRIDPVLERVDRLYALSLFNTETVGDSLTPGHGIDTCDLDAAGDWLAFGSAKTGQLLVWEWSTESYILRLSGVTTRSTMGMTCSAYSPDGQLIATGGGDGKIRIWQGERGGGSGGGECVATFTEHVGPITALAFTKQGHVLISASQDGSVRAFDILRFRAFKVLKTPQPVQFASLAVDASGEVVAAGTLDTNEIFLWSLQTGQIIEIFSGHTGPITSLAFEPTRGRLLASGSWDRNVRLWDIYANPDSKAFGDPFNHESDVLSLSFRPDGTELTVSTLVGTIVTWSVEGGMILSTIDGRLDISTKNLSGAAFHSICHSADGSCLLAAGTFSAVALYHLPTRTLLKQYPLGTHKPSPDSSSGKGLLQPLLESLNGSARSVLFSPTGRSWSCLTPEGLLIYSINDSILFDPFDLTPDLSPETVLSALNDGKHLQALVYALRLNVFSVQKVVFSSMPCEVIDLLLSQLPTKYLLPLLKMIANLSVPETAFPQEPFPLQKLFTWIASLLTHHTIQIKTQRVQFLPTLRVIQKAAVGQYKELAALVRDNSFEINRILLEITKLE